MYPIIGILKPEVVKQMLPSSSLYADHKEIQLKVGRETAHFDSLWESFGCGTRSLYFCGISRGVCVKTVRDSLNTRIASFIACLCRYRQAAGWSSEYFQVFADSVFLTDRFRFGLTHSWTFQMLNCSRCTSSHNDFPVIEFCASALSGLCCWPFKYSCGLGLSFLVQYV